MHLSTSSSEARAASHWIAMWLLTLVIVVSLFMAWEVVARKYNSNSANVEDNAELWSIQRERVNEAGDRALVLVGASRIQLGIDTAVLGKITNMVPVQLAIDANPFYPILKHLADDENVHGTIIVSAHAKGIKQAKLNEKNRANEWTNYFDSRNDAGPAVRINRYLTGIVEDASFSLKAGVLPHQQLLVALLNKNSGQYVTTLYDRSRRADYTKVDSQRLYRSRVNRMRGEGSPTFGDIKDFDKELAIFEESIRKLQARGVRVVLVRFPTDKEVWKIEQIRYPREKYWDKLAAYTAAETIHFKDYPDLSRFNLPDGSHLDYRDAIPFTESLAEIIFGNKEKQ